MPGLDDPGIHRNKAAAGESPPLLFLKRATRCGGRLEDLTRILAGADAKSPRRTR